MVLFCTGVRRILTRRGVYGRFRLFQQIGGNLVRQNIVSDRIQNKKEGETDGWKLDYKGIGSLVSPLNRHEWSWKVLFDKSIVMIFCSSRKRTWVHGILRGRFSVLLPVLMNMGWLMVTIDFIMSGIVVILSCRELTLSRQKSIAFLSGWIYANCTPFTAYSTFTRNFLLSNPELI